MKDRPQNYHWLDDPVRRRRLGAIILHILHGRCIKQEPRSIVMSEDATKLLKIEPRVEKGDLYM
jgi:hypothetical protein